MTILLIFLGISLGIIFFALWAFFIGAIIHKMWEWLYDKFSDRFNI